MSAAATARLTHVTHPLVQHKLSYLRDESTPTVHFRKLVNELTLLLTYEATKDFPTEPVEIETPLEVMDAQRISGKKVAVCPVLRAGVGMLEGTLSLISSARVGFIGMYRDEDTLEAIQYYVKLPDDLGERDAIVLDPMLATGNSSVAAVGQVLRQLHVVLDRLKRLLVAVEADEPDPSARDKREHALEHADPGPQDRADGHLLPGDALRVHPLEGRLDLDRLGREVLRRLVGEQQRHLVHELAEVDGRRLLVAQVRELVLHQRVRDDRYARGAQAS